MNFPVSPLEAGCAVLDCLIDIGSRYDGLWPSLIDLDSHEPLSALPPAIEGQRDCDRSLRGSNLMHDLPAIGLLYELARVQHRPSYAQAADRYLRAFSARAATPSGLFPWGEHSYIDLDTGGIGDGYLFPVYNGKNSQWWDGLPRPVWHDHLRQAPAWFWHKLATFSPSLVQSFSDGLDRHWLTDERQHYMRHAGIDRVMRHGFRPGNRYCDFPRHGGHYIVDLACAYVQEQRPFTREQLWRYADYWWSRYTPGQTLPLESTYLADASHSDHFLRAPLQTLSLAVSLLDAADILRGTDAACAAEFEKRGLVYLDEFLAAPHDPAAGLFVASYSARDRSIHERLPHYGSIYGLNPATGPALLCSMVYRRGGDRRFLVWAMHAARAGVRAALESRNPGDVPIVHSDRTATRVSTPGHAPALDPGLALELLCDLHELTGDAEWLASASLLWPVIHQRYFHKGLIRLASGCGWYESQSSPAYLLHGAVRFGLLTQGISIPPDYSAR